MKVSIRRSVAICRRRVYTVVAETRAEAEDKVAMIDRLPKEIDQHAAAKC